MDWLVLLNLVRQITNLKGLLGLVIFCWCIRSIFEGLVGIVNSSVKGLIDQLFSDEEMLVLLWLLGSEIITL